MPDGATPRATPRKPTVAAHEDDTRGAHLAPIWRAASTPISPTAPSPTTAPVSPGPAAAGFAANQPVLRGRAALPRTARR